MEVREFHPFDLEGMLVPMMQTHLGAGNSLTEYAMALKAGGEAFTATVDGKPIACIGLIKFWEGRKYVWAFLAPHMPCYKLSLTRAIVRWLRYHGAGRLETAIVCADPKAVRWAELFGFEREGTMRRWTEGGDDCFMYARVR